MDVTCQSCRATYKVDDAKIPAQGIKAKCPKCGHSFLLKKPDDDDVIAVGGDTSPPPEPERPPAADPFAGFGAAPVPDMRSSTAPADPFGGSSAAPDPFAGGFGGSAPAADPFAGGFGGGGFGSGGFDAQGGGNNAPAPGDIGGLFQAKTAFEIKRTNGEKIGPFDLFSIKQMIYEGGLNGSEMLLDGTGNWVPITTVEDLGEIFRLTGAQVPASDGGSSQWGGQPEAPKAGWAKHESAAPAPVPEKAAPAPMPAKGSRPAPQQVSSAPAAPVALDMGRKRGLGERVIIATEGVWSLSKSRGVRIAGAVVVLLAVLAGLGYQFRWQLAQVVGLAGPIEATRLVTQGDKTLASGERGPMLTALARYDEALKKYAKSADAQARSAEIAGAIWYRDPPRLDMKVMAEANLEKALARGETYAVARAQVRVALAKRDLPATEAALAKAAAMPEAATDPLLTAIRGDVAFEKGDMAAAEAAYVQAKGTPATAAHGGFGIARVKLRSREFDAAKAPLAEALALEPDNGGGRAMNAYLSSKTGGDLAAARKTLRELAASPSRFGIERSRASHYLGVLSEEAGLPSPALHHMRDAVRHYPADADVVGAAKRLFTARFPESNADTWIASISKVHGSTAMERVQTAEIEFQRRNWQAALSPLIAAVQEDTANAAPQYALGLLLVEVSEAEKVKAKANFERAIAIDAEWAEPVIALARWQLDAKAIPEARALGTQSVKLDPTLPDAYRVVAAGAMAAKDYAQAEESLQLAVEFDPEDYISWLDLGEARRLAGNAQEAIPAIEKAAALRPELAEPRIRLGAAYEALGELARANEFYVEAAKIDPANQMIATRAGVIDARQANYIEARKRLEAVVKAQSSNAEAQYWLGIAHHQTGEPEKAIDAYRAAIKADYFDKYLAHWHMGEILGGPGATRDVDAARDQLNKCLEAKPEHFQCIEEQAKIAISENQYDEAVKVLRSVETAIAKLPSSQKDPVIVRVQLQQGKIFRQQGKVKEAEALFRRILKQEKNAEVMWNLGELARENDTKRAKDWFQQAIKANPAYAPPYRDLGYIQKEEGQDCAARRNLEFFLAKTPSEKDKKPVEEDLQTLDCGK